MAHISSSAAASPVAALALLAANDGHDVTVLERDAAPPPTDADEAWDSWERRGVNQFRMLHYFLARFRQIIRRSCPMSSRSSMPDGALRINPFATMPEQISGGGLRTSDDALRSAHRPAPGGRGSVRPRGRGPSGHHRASRRRACRACWSTTTGPRRGPPRRGCGHRGRRRGARRSGRRRRRAALGAARLARRHRCPPADRRERGLRVRLLRPPLPLGRRFGAASRSGHRCSSTTRSRSSRCRPTTAPGESVWSTSAGDAALAPSRDDDAWERVVRALSARRPLDRRRTDRRQSSR